MWFCDEVTGLINKGYRIVEGSSPLFHTLKDPVIESGYVDDSSRLSKINLRALGQSGPAYRQLAVSDATQL